MITSDQIKHLTNLRNKDHLISSLYLHLLPDQRIHQTEAKDMIRKKLEGFGQENSREVKKDLNRIWEFVETTRDSPHKGLAIFSCTAAGVWQVFFLSQPVRDLLVVDASAYIRPLTAILDRYRRVCTLLVDRTKARIFEVFMDEIEEQTEIFTDVPSKVKEGGWYGLAERRIERHTKQHLHDHLKKVSDRAFTYFRDKGFDWLLLGGQMEVVPEMENALHSSLRKILKRTFRVDLNATETQVLDMTLELEQEIKEQEDKILISRLTDSLRSGGLGVTGLQETLSSLYEGSVHTLVAEESFSQEGAYCRKCGFMGLSVGTCPMCGEAMSFAPDIVEEAIAVAMDQNCEVVQVTPGTGLGELGSIGALLRYKTA